MAVKKGLGKGIDALIPKGVVVDSNVNYPCYLFQM